MACCNEMEYDEHTEDNDYTDKKESGCKDVENNKTGNENIHLRDISNGDSYTNTCDVDHTHHKNESADNHSERKHPINNLDLLPLSFFPLLQVLDEELHSSLVTQIDFTVTDTESYPRDEESFVETSREDENINIECEFVHHKVTLFARILQKWISSWFCCHDTLPLEVVSRVIDFLLASHPFMPL